MSKLDKEGARAASGVAKIIQEAMKEKRRTPLFTMRNMIEELDALVFEPRRSLCGEFFYEREISIVVGQTGVGKSVFCLQVLEQIARGNTPDQHFGLECEAEAQKVLYLDFENDAEEWKERIGPKKLSRNLYRAKFSSEADASPSAEDIVSEILRVIGPGGEVEGCKVIGIDNITWLFDGKERDMHQESAQLFKLLKRVSEEHQLTVLIAAHRNKGDVDALELSSVSGSSKNGQFVHNIFGIAAARGDQDHGRIYLKQLKQRSRKAKWTSYNVLTADLKRYDGTLQVVTSREVYNERALLDGTGKSYRSAVLECLLEDPDMSGAAIAEKLGTTRQNVNRLIREGDLRSEARRMMN